MTPQELKASILQLAIQGKLVEQRPEEGTGENLYEQIKMVEAQECSGKRKGKSKNIILPISEDDIPFDVPEMWKWVRLGTIGYTNIGLTYSPKDIADDGTIVLRSSNIQKDRMDYEDIVRVKIDIPENKMCHIGDILICARNGSKRLVGKATIIDKEGMSFGAFMAIFRSPCNEYVLQFINSAYFRNSLLGDTGTTTINQITQDMLKNALIPLPPLAEQRRIVAKIEELLPLIERYEQAWSKLEEFNKKFPVDMQKSVLQMAIQGKLVEQRPEEGSGEELFKQIQAEKQELIKSGKIKKQKALPEITDDEIPFDIPESWKWVRLGDCSSYSQTKKKVASTDITGNMWSLDLEDIQKETGEVVKQTKASERKITGDKVRFYKGQILYSKLRPYLKKILIAPADGICTPELVPFDTYLVNAKYLVYVLRSPHVDFVVNSVTYGVKMPRVGTDTMVNLLVPLPPLAEQKRIVQKLEDILPLCEKLK